MHEIKEKLMDELYDYEEKLKKASGGKVSSSDLDMIHKLTDTVKNICKIEMIEDGEYSEASDWMGEGRMYGMSYDGGSSYARGRGRNAKRDSMGRYSRDGYIMEGSSSYERGGNRGGSGRGNSRGGSRGGQGSGYGRAGGYSRDDAKHDMIEELEELMGEAESEKERDALRRCIRAIEEA